MQVCAVIIFIIKYNQENTTFISYYQVRSDVSVLDLIYLTFLTHYIK